MTVNRDAVSNDRIAAQLLILVNRTYRLAVAAGVQVQTKTAVPKYSLLHPPFC